MALKLKNNFDPAKDHFIGNPKAPVSMVEYGDYTCPECRQVRDILLRLSERFKKRISFTYRHFVGKDELATLVAQAAEAAGMQGKFWEMHGKLFDRHAKFDEQSLIDYAAEIGLDTETFKSDLHSDKAKARVKEDYLDALSSGARVTPTLFIDGREYRGAWDELSIVEALEKPLGVRLEIAGYDFINWAASVGFTLIFATIAALLFVNIGFSEQYHHLVQTPLSIGFGKSSFSLPLEAWVNDGLMAIFFLLIGIEIKREVLVGELSTFRKAALPIAAAFGGMLFPALIYTFFNVNTPTQHAWGTPMATDIAFALGLMALLGSRLPTSLKVFVSALAVADDLGAIIVIALFYGTGVNYGALLSAGVVVAVLIVLNRIRIYNRTPYLILGIVLWYFVYQSGLHATLAGIILAVVIPTRKEANVADIAAQTSAVLKQEMYHIDSNEERDRESTISSFSLQSLGTAFERLRDPGFHIEYGLQHWSNYLILPAFAFMNMGILLTNSSYAISEPQNIGVILGLCVGKPIGILIFTWLCVKSGLADLSNELNWLHIIGAGLLAGVGFTMSIFIANAAFTESTLQQVKLSILIASALSALCGLGVLYFATRNVPHEKTQI